MTEAWQSLVATVPFSPALLFALGAWLLHGVFGVGLAVALTECQRRGWLARYRISPGSAPPPGLIRASTRELVVSHLLLFPVFFWLLSLLLLWRGLRVDASVPAWSEVAWSLLLYVLADETAFYWLHRLMHRPWFFHRIHRRHHAFRFNTGVAVEYFHPAESLLLALSLLSGPLLLGGHVLTVWLWLALRFWESVDAHGDYHFPWSLAARHHAIHHRHNRGWYGSFFNLWDRALGTRGPVNSRKRAGR